MPPQIIQFPEDQKVRAGEPVELFGKVTGTQPITCTWMKFRKQVSNRRWSKDNPQPLGMRKAIMRIALLVILEMGKTARSAGTCL
jgi:myosin-light-chain kinase